MIVFQKWSTRPRSRSIWPWQIKYSNTFHVLPLKSVFHLISRSSSFNKVKVNICSVYYITKQIYSWSNKGSQNIKFVANINTMLLVLKKKTELVMVVCVCSTWREVIAWYSSCLAIPWSYSLLAPADAPFDCWSTNRTGAIVPAHHHHHHVAEWWVSEFDSK